MQTASEATGWNKKNIGRVNIGERETKINLLSREMQSRKTIRKSQNNASGGRIENQNVE